MPGSNFGYAEIEARGNTEFYPLSFQQERVLYLSKLSAGSPLWNRVSCKRLFGSIDVRSLERSINALIHRHAVLRTRISMSDGTPLQSRHESMPNVFEYIDLSGKRDPQAEAQAILNREYEKPILLEGGQLFRAILAVCSPSESWLILKLHHIISDETTFRTLWDDLKTLYRAQFGVAKVPDALRFEYFDYAAWVREQSANGRTREQESYWVRQFDGELPELDLPADSTTPPQLTFRGSLEKERLPHALIRRVQSFSLTHRVIVFSTMLSAHFLLLHKYCGQDDIVLGTVFSGRHYSPKLKSLPGFFSNTVALRAHIDPAQSAGEFVKFIHSQVTDAHRMQDYPLQYLVDRLAPDRENKRNPLFRAMFNMITGYEERRTFHGIHGEEWVEPDISATQVDFFLDFHMNPGSSELRVEYNADIFLRATIRRMLRHYLVLLHRMMDCPGTRLRELSMLDAAEEQLVLSLAAGEPAPGAQSRSIVELIETRATRAPEEPALLCAKEFITCGDLNRRANRLAATLIRSGICEGDRVAIMTDRSPAMVLGVLAILKAGGAYVPIEPAFPHERIAYILRDSGARILLADSGAIQALARNNGSPTVRCVSIDDEGSYTGDGGSPGRMPHPSSAAYVIYTSGSTGSPKGVVVSHRALNNTLEFLEGRYPLARKTFLLKTSFTFDVSAAELFGWLFESGRLAVLAPGGEKDPRQLLAAIDQYGVTHINFVPSMLGAFLSGLQESDIATLQRLNYVFAAGEALKPELVNRFHRTIAQVRLENLYGPTEAAIYATAYSVPRNTDLARVSIGKPIANTRSYILDENLRLLPVGLTGELCLSGAGLAEGYLNQHELTREKFCPNPYWEGQTIYRTGDLAKWDEDGCIHFIGRRDGQVKIRGFRVELGEVERKLLACPAVAEAVVTARTDQFGEKELVAYFSWVKGREGCIDEIRKEMAAWLPTYMIPDLFVTVELFPRLPSGKVDLRSLPEPRTGDPDSADRRRPATELELTIVAIAERLLNTTGLGPDSNFFRLGGNSLLTLRFIAALDEALGTHLSVMDFLELPTISEIARLIQSSLQGSSGTPPAGTTAKPYHACCGGNPARS